MVTQKTNEENNECLSQITSCGCLLEDIRMNADDIAKPAPSAIGLQRILLTLQEGIRGLETNGNPALCAYVVCRIYRKLNNITSTFTTFGHKIERVKNAKYLYFILSGDMSTTFLLLTALIMIFSVSSKGLTPSFDI